MYVHELYIYTYYMLVFGLSFVYWKELTPSLHWQLIECKLERERESEREEALSPLPKRAKLKWYIHCRDRDYTKKKRKTKNKNYVHETLILNPY